MVQEKELMPILTKTITEVKFLETKMQLRRFKEEATNIKKEVQNISIP